MLVWMSSMNWMRDYVKQLERKINNKTTAKYNITDPKYCLRNNGTVYKSSGSPPSCYNTKEITKAEFEKLLADEEEGDDMPKDEDEAEMDMEDQMDLESVEYDLDEEVKDEDDVVEEATKLSDKVAKQPVTKDSPNDDNKDAPLPSGGSKVEASGSPVKSKDGGEGNHGDSAKDHTPSDNIKVEPKKV